MSFSHEWYNSSEISPPYNGSMAVGSSVISNTISNIITVYPM
jgi:hypothetical protein